MEPLTVFLLFLAAFSASTLGGILGMASGIFIVPILTAFFGIDIHTAITTSIVSVIACSCASAAPFLRERLVPETSAAGSRFSVKTLINGEKELKGI